MSHRIMVGMPLYGGTIHCETVDMLLEAKAMFHGHGWTMKLQHSPGVHDIHMGRNLIVREFLQGDFTDLFWIDSDVYADPALMVDFIHRDTDILSGFYPQRQDGPPVFIVIPPPGGFAREPDGLVEHHGCGIGFTRVTRIVMLAMVNHIKHKQPHSWYAHADKQIWPVFSIGERENLHVAEDRQWFDAARAQGWPAYGDPDAKVCHVGKATFSGDFRFIHGIARRPVADVTK
jgi:hypothetical protein